MADETATDGDTVVVPYQAENTGEGSGDRDVVLFKSLETGVITPGTIEDTESQVVLNVGEIREGEMILDTSGLGGDTYEVEVYAEDNDGVTEGRDSFTLEVQT